MPTSTIYERRTPGQHLVLLCKGEHRVDVEAWSTTRPTVCPIATCGERFLTPNERAARTRAAMRAIESAFSVETPMPIFDREGMVIDFEPAPPCENPF